MYLEGLLGSLLEACLGRLGGGAPLGLMGLLWGGLFKRPPGGLLGASWGLQGASWGGKLEISVRGPLLGPLLGPSWGPLGLS